jgi:hypothetical protein
MKANKRKDLTWDENVVILEAEYESRVKKAMNKKNKKSFELTYEELNSLAPEKLKQMQIDEMHYDIEKYKHRTIQSAVGIFAFLVSAIVFWFNPYFPWYISFGFILGILPLIRAFNYSRADWDNKIIVYRAMLIFYKEHRI